jgi:RimJ/RimL family protein N-acetyltransferase
MRGSEIGSVQSRSGRYEVSRCNACVLVSLEDTATVCRLDVREAMPDDVSVEAFEIRQACAEDGRALAELFAAVAEERDGIATEPPVDVAARTRDFGESAAGTIVAVAGGEIVGSIHLEASRHGFAEIGMAVARAWRGRGIGSALLAAGIEKARAEGLHKLSLEVFPQNEAALALYRRFGFVEEGRRRKHYRRASGELWDSIVMGIQL